ncbi:MAG: hypothetical protein J7K81_04235 [Methanophagales archaeon]|nr:hypothetical protein [Methanophagales archaeon]
MVGGRIKPPVVEIRNEKIVRRHLHSIVLAMFFREYPDYFGIAQSFFKLENGGVIRLQMLKEYLNKRPLDLLNSLKRTIPKNMHATFDLESWGWVKDFTDKDGSLEIADAKIRDEYTHLQEFYEQRDEEYRATRNQRIRNRLNADMAALGTIRINSVMKNLNEELLLISCQIIWRIGKDRMLLYRSKYTSSTFPSTSLVLSTAFATFI